MNFLRLCELLVKSCKSLAEIHLLTGTDPSPQAKEEQVRKLEELKADLLTRNINLTISFSDTLHDRRAHARVPPRRRFLGLGRPGHQALMRALFDAMSLNQRRYQNEMLRR